MIDPTALLGSSHGGGIGGAFDAADVDYLPADFPRRLFWESSRRFQNRSDRIIFTRAVRNEDIVVPIPDPLISDEDANFVAYVAPERRTIEARARQTLANNIPVVRRPKVGETDQSDRDVEQIISFGEGLKTALLDWDAIVGKAVEDGEWAMVLQYDLDYLLALPLPSEVLTDDEWQALPAGEQDAWHRCQLSNGRTSYRRYRQQYHRDREGRRPNDRYYTTPDPSTGKRKPFERNDLATRRAWREHMKQIGEGHIPICVRMVPALDCAPLLVRGTHGQRWETRGLSIRTRCTQSDLVAQGLRWDDMPGILLERGYDADQSGRFVDLYEAHVYLTNPVPQPGDPEMVPCVVYQVDGKATWRDGSDGNEPAVLNLWQEYGLDFLPAEYFFGPHSEDDEAGQYGFPLMYSMLATILNQEGNRTAYQAHLRKYSFAKLAMTPSKDAPPSTYLNSDGSIKDIDMDADIVMLPGPIGPMVSPPEPQAIRDLDLMYSRTLAENTPDQGGQANDASGHALSVAQNQFLSANLHVRDGARRCVEWTLTTVLRMLAALDEKYGVRCSVDPSGDVPTDTVASSPRKATIEFDPRWFRGRYAIKAVYPDVGNLAEIQQEADLKERGLSTFRRVMEKKGVTDVFSERVEVMADKFWESEQGLKLLFLETLKRRGDMERAAILEAQMQGDATPDGLPTAALPPGVAAVGQPGMPPGMMPPGGQPMLPPGPGGMAPPPGAPPMAGVQLPSFASSALGGIVGGQMGSASLMSDAHAAAQVPGGV